MKKKLRGVKRRDILFDYDLYRRKVPIPGVENTELSVLDLWPEGAERTIMFVHGYAGVLESWEFQINYFAGHNYRVIAPDLRGHGQSDAPYTNYTMDEMVADLYAITQHLDVSIPFTLVAHSFGGSIAVEYANAHPEQLEKLVLIATAGEFPLPAIANYLLKLPLDWFKPLWKYRNRWDAEIHVVKRMMANNMRHWKGWSLMRSITTPTLIITGERDNYFPRWVFEDVGKMMPEAEMVDVGSAKHKVQLERHQAVTRAIERFVEGRHGSWRSTISQDNPLQNRPWIKSYGQGTPPTIPIPRRPLHDFLESTADWLPQRTATIFYGSKMTYKELNEQAHQMSHVFHGMGVRPGDRVMLILPNMPQMVVAFYGVLRAGGIAVLPNPDANSRAIVRQVQETQPKVLVTIRSFSELAHLVKETTGLSQFIFADLRTAVSYPVYKKLIERFGIADNEEQHKAEAKALGQRMSLVRQDAPTTPLHLPVSHQGLAVIIYTSGTTARPKGVALSHYNLVANSLQTRHWVPDLAYGKEVCLSVVPLLHSYGLITAMNMPIIMGATLVLQPVFEVQQVLEDIRDHEVSVFPGVPSMYMAINQAPGVRQYGLSSVKACISGAAPLPVEVQEAFEKLSHGRLVEGYGLTEASPVTHANPLYGVRKPGSIGVPLPNTEAKIVDFITKEEVAVGQIGEMLVRGPQIMQGYWQSTGTLNKEALLQDGWLDTGDVAVQDSDGYFRIISRKKDTIVFGEYTVFPRDVEEVLYEHPRVLEVAVVGIGKIGEGQKVKAYVVPRPGTTLTKEELLELCRRRLEPFAVPWDIEFRETLPKSFIGKVLRRLLVDPTQ
ncbi:MAG: alpha/beta fold hydrolase [Ardenticatenaceae bacterium]|nr:alpha/beta fold hydrolase [Anaerolineales bacterium]MCB8923826.1 alpha/beta fold hydrolase [Ardenticatenaceae bacterium]MCB9003395.1 alpha/beta fold hydrolase [Ardenticatenaceae bacterium]